MAAILNQVQGLASKNMNAAAGAMVDEQVYGYVADVSEILCEHGIDIDKLLDVTHKDLTSRGVFVNVLISKIADDIKMILDNIGIGFLMPIDVTKVAAGIFSTLKTKGTFKCPLRFKAQESIVNLNPPSIKKRANKLKLFLGLEKKPGLLNTLMKSMTLSKEKEPETSDEMETTNIPPPPPPPKTNGGKRKTRKTFK